MVSNSWEHLLDELQLLNACLLRDIRRRTQKNQHLDMLQGLILNESEIIEILKNPPGTSATPDAGDDLQERINTRNGKQYPNTSLTQLSSLFELERIEELCLLLCLAPEIDPRYARIFAFLQDDVTRKQPSIELALRIFSRDVEESLVTRKIFSSASALFRNRLIQLAQASDKFLPLPQRTLKLDDRITAFLLHVPQIDECLSNWVEFILPPSTAPSAALPDEIIQRTLTLVESSFSGNGPFLRPLIHVYGKLGSGRRLLATIASQHVGLPLLVADVRRMPSVETNDIDPLWRLCREALLLPAVLLIENFDDLLQDGKHRELSSLLDASNYFSPATFLSGSERWRCQNPKQFYLSLECPLPDATSRIDFWRQHLNDNSKEFQDNDLIELSSKFNFTEGQIHQAVRTAEHRAYWERRSVKDLTPTLVNEAARGIAAPRLGGLARKIETPFTWSDIVLPEGQLVQLREIATHAKRSQIVFENWGYGRTFAYGRGIAALFEGQSGTGKTMAASIIGRALGLDVYQIDLSCVVSKYIGETEKNLSLIFSEAQDSNAVLFFDEADALFGKRSEVKDAHDRYANIETAYLLQRMEEYSGIVILATNMKQNLDEAFVRRMRFIIHFPFPNDDDRERIWHKVFPGNAPLGEDVNFRWLSRKLKIAGGNIKNISLRAAFLAVERNGQIGMDCVIEAAKRESEKIGKIDGLADLHFKQTAGVAEVA